MDERFTESAWRRGWNDTKQGWANWRFLLTEAVVSPLAGYIVGAFSGNAIAGSVVTIAIVILGLVSIWVGATVAAPYRQRNEARAALQAIPGSSTAPILADPQLFFSNLFCNGFGYGGEGNFGGLDSSKWYGDVSALAHAQSKMTITQIALVIDGHELPATRWNTYEVGVGNYLCSFPVEIAQTIGAGRHEANVLAFANGKSWKSPHFLVEVPRR